MRIPHFLYSNSARQSNTPPAHICDRPRVGVKLPGGISEGMVLRALLKQQLAQLTRSTQKRQRRFLRIWDQRPISNASSALGLRRCKAFVVPFVKFVPAVRAIPFWGLPLYVTICGRGARNPSSVLRFFPGLTSPPPQFLSGALLRLTVCMCRTCFDFEDFWS